MLQQLVSAVASMGLPLIMVAAGLQVSGDGFRQVASRPGALLRSFLAVNVVVPLFAWMVVLAFRPSFPFSMGIVLLAASPAAPLALVRISSVTGRREHTAGIHLILACLAFFTTPFILMLLTRSFGFEVSVAPAVVARQVALVLVLPVGGGILLRRLSPRFALRLGPHLALAGTILLFGALALVFVGAAKSLLSVDGRSYAAMATFVVAALFAGHLLAAGSSERTTLALESASRNIGLAMLMAAQYFSPERILSVIVPYTIVFLVVSSAYLWLGRRFSAERRTIPSALKNRA